jgi:predicted porin
MDTIYKEYGDTLNMFGVKSGNFTSGSNVLSHIGFGRNNNARFHERAANSIMYETPEFGGVTAGIQYMPDERWGNPAITRNRKLLSTGVKYDSKQFYVSLAHERHTDWFGGSSNVTGALSNIGDPHSKSKDNSTRLSGTYRMGTHEFTLDIARMKWEEETAVAGVHFKSYRHVNWAVGWEARLGGPWRGSAQYVRGGAGTCELTGGASCSTTGLASWMLSGGVAYDLDRQTRLYTLVSRLNNGPSAIYDNSSVLNPARGADITQAALGIVYNF